MTPACFYMRALAAPLSVFLFAAAVLAITDLDVAVARGLFFDSSQHAWRGAHSWIANDLLHTGGAWLIRGIVAMSLLVWLGTFAGIAPNWRRAAGFFALSAVLTVGMTGWLKTVTNVDCPWDLTPFGGQYPYVPLFGDRPDDLRYGRCFPAAHAGSGYVLLALYFAFRERSRRLARASLAIGMIVGLVFGLAQQSRGAHFLSHDVWSAMIAWTVSLTVYAWVFRARLWDPLWPPPEPRRHNTHSTFNPDTVECAAVHGTKPARPSRLARSFGLRRP
jgi:membrane-associated PAP2 superfamily phosphatase